MKKLPEGWLYVPVSPETWSLISRIGDQEKAADEVIREVFASYQSERVGTDGLTDSEYEHTKLVQEIETLHDKLQSEREKVLDELDQIMREEEINYERDGYESFVWILHEVIPKLRSKQEEK